MGRTKQQKIADWEKEAGQVCRDFDIFCDYLLNHKAKISKSTGDISKKDCFELNSLLSVKEEFERPTYFQKRYPVINYFYYAAVSYKILEPDLAGGCMRSGRNYGCYKDAADLEKFLLMLKGILFDGRFAEYDFSYELNVSSFMEWAVKTRPCVNKIYCLPRGAEVGYYLGGRNNLVAYLEELGVLKVCVWDGKEAGRKIQPCEIEIRPLFELMCDLLRALCDDFDEEKEDLATFCFGTYWETHLSEGKESALKKIFEKLETDYENQTADLEIKVRNGACIRVVRMNLSDSLYKLHLMIQKVFEFGNDHLFAFYIGHGMMKTTFTIPEAFTSGDEYSVHDMAIGDLEPRVGDKFSYLFDFGDAWWFDIKVKAVTDGSVPAPELIKSVHDAPVQYPDYEGDDYDEDQWQALVDKGLKVSTILSAIDDEYIVDEYAVLNGINKDYGTLSCEEMRREIERIVLEEPKRLLLFMTPQMRETLVGLLKDSWVDSSLCCQIARLYSFGFCMMPDENEDEVRVPGQIKEVYGAMLKKTVKADALAETAEYILSRCGVMEMDKLYAASGADKSKMSYDEFEFMIYSRLNYFGNYGYSNYDGQEMISCYDTEVTQKILDERKLPENRGCIYPDFAHMSQEELEKMPESVEEWRNYVRFNLSIDWGAACELAEQIPSMAASGVIEKDKIIERYKEMIRKAGGRATKKSERLIGNLCETMPLATRKGNRRKEKAQEYRQISLFD